MDIEHSLIRAPVSSKGGFFPCPVCSSAIKWDQNAQNNFERGGVGHHCQSCNSYIGVVACSACSATYLMDDEEWCSFSSENPYTCKECSLSLLPTTHQGVSISTSTIETQTLFSSDIFSSEEVFIVQAKKNLDHDTLIALAIYHQTTTERFRVAQDNLEQLIASEIGTSFVFSNNSELNDIKSKDSLELKNSYHGYLYVFVTSLFSAIESLLQEVNLICLIKDNEWKVDYRLLGNIPAKYAMNSH